MDVDAKMKRWMEMRAAIQSKNSMITLKVESTKKKVFFLLYSLDLILNLESNK